MPRLPHFRVRILTCKASRQPVSLMTDTTANARSSWRAAAGPTRASCLARPLKYIRW